MPSVGDRVNYIPCVKTHELDKDAKGNYIFSFVLMDDRPGKEGEQPIKLTDKQVDDFLKNVVRRNPGARKRLIATTAKQSWPAVVRGISEDDGDLLDLEISYCLPGVFHCYNEVPHDPTGKTPGTWN